MRVVWSTEARDELRDIARYIARLDPTAALQLSARIRTTVLLLTNHPFLGHKGPVPGTRELFPHPNYRVVYQAHADRVVILSVLHVRRQYP